MHHSLAAPLSGKAVWPSGLDTVTRIWRRPVQSLGAPLMMSAALMSVCRAIPIHAPPGAAKVVEVVLGRESRARELAHVTRHGHLQKKNDPAQCENYRPISLSTVGYKLFATVLLQRLKDAVAEGRIWPTQFAFKSNSGTSDALFLARRLIEEVCESKGGSAVLLAHNWAKAPDSLDPSALKRALVRSGSHTHSLTW